MKNKQLFLGLAALLLNSIFLFGCSKDEDNATVESLSGKWANTFDGTDDYGNPIDSAVDIWEIKGNTANIWHCTNLSYTWQPRYENGLLICDDPEMSAEFEFYFSLKFTVTGDRILVGNIAEYKFKWINQNKIHIWDQADPDGIMVLQRIKEIKNIEFI